MFFCFQILCNFSYKSYMVGFRLSKWDLTKLIRAVFTGFFLMSILWKNCQIYGNYMLLVNQMAMFSHVYVSVNRS
jgi:hypothetical protein